MPTVVNVTPRGCLPPHRVTDESRLEGLIVSLEASGWSGSYPALVGYRSRPEGPIQLLSGSHRHEAATRLGIAIPVVVWEFKDVVSAWGDLEKWKTIMESGTKGSSGSLCV
jgi:hypothetical protein